MTETEHKIDRTGWDPGPWDDEPDKLNWTTEAGLPGMIVRNNSGALCGYVGLPPEHPAHGTSYNSIDVSVHGGLTYAARCAGPICHVPEPGQSDDVWWFGFDCIHYDDAYPMQTAYAKRFPNWPKSIPDGLSGTYRDIAYVRGEVESLARQLAEMVK